MKINRVGSGPSSYAPAESFSGTVRRDTLISAEAPGRVATGLVTFEPGARTAWHTHPAGQILIVTAGRGWVQSKGSDRQEVCPAIPSGFRPAKNTGMARPTRQPCRILP